MTNALILNDINYVYLMHNCKNGQSRYEFPGGKYDPEKDKSLIHTTIRELWEEFGVEIKVLDAFGDFLTKTPEGDFLCRTYHSQIIKGTPKIMEPSKCDWSGYVNYKLLKDIERQGKLAPNLVKALPQLKQIISNEVPKTYYIF